MKKTVDYYKSAINAALSARASIEAANAEHEKWSRGAKEELNDGLLGDAGYQERLKKLAEDRDAKIEAALSRIDAISAEYAAEMAELGRLDGSRIDDGTMKLLNSGVKLSAEDWQELADAHRDSYIMTRILKERYEASRPEADPTAQSFLTGGAGKAEKAVCFSRTPQDMTKKFDDFARILYFNAQSDGMPREGIESYASKADYWNHLAKKSLAGIQSFGGEDFGDLDQAFPVEMFAAKATVW